MDLKEKFEKRIKKKEQEIEGLETKIAEARAYLQALQDSMRDLPKNNTNGTASDIKLRPGSMCHSAFELLKKSGKPLHIKDVIEGIGKEFNKSTRASLRGSLGPYLKQGRMFKLTAPNTFGLVGIEYKEESTEKEEKEGNDVLNPF